MSLKNLRYLPVETVARRADPDRKVELAHSATPIFSFEAIARNLTKPSHRRKYGSGWSLVRAGDEEVTVSHLYEIGWPCLIQMTPGRPYKVDVFECEKVVPVTELPYDQRADNGVIFFGVAHFSEPMKDEANQRVMLGESVAVWTDGVLVREHRDNRRMKPGRIYKVVIEAMPLQ